jgi:hypothetical protein
MTFAEADAGLGKRTSRKLCNNTYAERIGPDMIGIRLHWTTVATIRRDGWVIISPGGWDTVTTWARINAVLPPRFGCHSRRGNRTLWHDGHPILPFVDLMAVNERGEIGILLPHGGTAELLLSVEQVAEIEAEDDARQMALAEKRTARLLREHPVAFGPRNHNHNAYEGRIWYCQRCEVERAKERADLLAKLKAEHMALNATLARNPTDADPWTEAEYEAAGSHVYRTHHFEWPKRLDGTSDYKVEPKRIPYMDIMCPWDCPGRSAR